MREEIDFLKSEKEIEATLFNPSRVYVTESAERNDRDHLMHPPRHCYIVTDSLCQVLTQF